MIRAECVLYVLLPLRYTAAAGCLCHLQYGTTVCQGVLTSPLSRAGLHKHWLHRVPARSSIGKPPLPWWPA